MMEDRSMSDPIPSLRHYAAKLASQETLYRTLIESLPHVVWLGEADGHVTFLNQAWEKLTGRGIEDSLGARWAESLHPGDVSTVLGKWERAYKHGEPYHGECRFQAGDGSFRTIDFVGTPVRDSSGKIVRWVGINTDVTERKRAEEALRRSEEKLRALGVRLVEVAEMQRRRLAQDLHDEVGQTLTAIGFNLSFVLNVLAPDITPPVMKVLREAIKKTEEVTERIRGVMSDLRPPGLDDYGLVAALRWYCESIEERSQVKARVDSGEQVVGLSPDQEIALFRITQEALTNAVKHSGAHQITVTLEDTPRGVRLTIADDGVGFDPAALSEESGWGRLIMRERALAVGGKKTMESAPGEGTRVIVELGGD